MFRDGILELGEELVGNSSGRLPDPPIDATDCVLKSTEFSAEKGMVW